VDPYVRLIEVRGDTRALALLQAETRMESAAHLCIIPYGRPDHPGGRGSHWRTLACYRLRGTPPVGLDVVCALLYLRCALDCLALPQDVAQVDPGDCIQLDLRAGDTRSTASRPERSLTE
jgi:hypothetical protein